MYGHNARHRTRSAANGIQNQPLLEELLPGAVPVLIACKRGQVFPRPSDVSSRRGKQLCIVPYRHYALVSSLTVKLGCFSHDFHEHFAFELHFRH